MRIGVTGHQDLSDVSSINELKSTLKSILIQEKASVGFTSLAVGADQVFADVCNELSIKYCAIIPANDYEENFESNDKVRYKKLLNGASDTHYMPFEQSSEEAFYKAGIHVSNSSDCIVAIWNGKAAKGLGGTGDIVKYSLDNGKKVVQILPSTLAVTYL